MDISNRLQPVSVRTNQNGLVVSSEKLVVTLVAAIVSLSVYSVQMSHAPLNVGIRSLNQHVVMVRHLAISRNPHIPDIGSFPQKIREHNIVLIIRKYDIPSTSPVHDMVPCLRIFYS